HGCGNGGGRGCSSAPDTKNSSIPFQLSANPFRKDRSPECMPSPLWSLVWRRCSLLGMNGNTRHKYRSASFPDSTRPYLVSAQQTQRGSPQHSGERSFRNGLALSWKGIDEFLVSGADEHP